MVSVSVAVTESELGQGHLQRTRGTDPSLGSDAKGSERIVLYGIIVNTMGKKKDRLRQ